MNKTLIDNIIASNGNPLSHPKLGKIVAIQQIEPCLCEITYDNGIGYTIHSLAGYVNQVAANLNQDSTTAMKLLTLEKTNIEKNGNTPLIQRLKKELEGK